MEPDSKQKRHGIPFRSGGSVSSLLMDRALASTAEGITISDPSLPDNPLIYVNSGFEQMTGYTSTEVLGKNCRFLQGPQTDKDAADEIRRAIRQDRPCVVEILNYRKNGSPFWNRLSITPVKDEQGKTTHFIGVQSDITRTKDAEEALRKAKEQVERTNEGMKQALYSAARIQRALLPEKPICTAQVHLCAKLVACEELAGDMLNYFWIDASHIACYVLDVAGHGVPAALYSVTLSHFLSPSSGRSLGSLSESAANDSVLLLSPVQVAFELNKMFQLNARNSRFFTLLYGVYDIENRIFEYVSAGHPALLRQTVRGEIEVYKTDGFPIGVVEKPEYEQIRLPLLPGDRLFLYSDGLLEIHDPQGQMLDIEGLSKILTKYHGRPVQRLFECILQEIRSFSGKDSFEDDISIMVLQAQNKKHKST